MTFDKSEFRKNTKIAWDVDLTLITHDDRPIYENINILRWFINKGCSCYVWSGGGITYADMWVRRLGLEGLVTVVAKGSFKADLAFDDEIASDLGKTLIIV